MSTETTNYGFIKDDENEFYNVLRVNANLDRIDKEIKKVEDKTNINIPVKSVNSKTGNVVLTAEDVQAAAKTHSHTATEIIADGDLNIQEKFKQLADDTMEVGVKADSNYLTLHKAENEGLLSVDFKGQTINNLFRPSEPQWVTSPDDRLMIHDIVTKERIVQGQNTYINCTNKPIVVTVFDSATLQYKRSIGLVALGKLVDTLGANEYIKEVVGLSTRGWANTSSDKELLKKSLIILDYDATTIPISPNYTTGLQSLFQPEGWVAQGNTTSKNLIDTQTKGKFTEPSATVTTGKNLLRVTTKPLLAPWACITTLITLKPHTDYVLSYYSRKINGDLGGTSVEGKMSLRDLSTGNGFVPDLNNNVSGGRISTTFNSGNRTKVQLNIFASGATPTQGTVEYWSVQLEEGKTLTDFQYHKEDNLKSIISPLRKIDENNYDEVVGSQVIRRCGEQTLNGYETMGRDGFISNWVITPNYSSDVVTCFSIGFAYGWRGASKVIVCDKFAPTSPMDNSPNEAIHMGAWDNSNSSFMIKVSNSKTGIVSTDTENDKVNKFKTWLRTNNVKVVYPYKTPLNEPCTPLILKSFKNTSVYLDSLIYPRELKITYPKTLSASVSSLNQAVELKDVSYPNITIQNSKWEKYSDTDYRYNIILQGMTDSHSPEVIFKIPEDAEGISTYAGSYNGGAILYANTKIEKDLSCLIFGRRII